MFVGVLNPEMLSEFRNMPQITSMSLSETYRVASQNNTLRTNIARRSADNNLQETATTVNQYNIEYAKRLLLVIGSPYGFKHLRRLRLSKLPIFSESLKHLQGLISLETLHIDGTMVTNEGIAYLVALKPNLRSIDLSQTAISDGTFFNLFFLTNLRSLQLDGTNITMEGLRRFVKLKGKGTSLERIGLPKCCYEYLRTTRHKLYFTRRVPELVEDPAEVTTMTLQEVRQQLKIHHVINCNIEIVGTEHALRKQLVEVLERRALDETIWVMSGQIPINSIHYKY
jgi:hypothetical protein